MMHITIIEIHNLYIILNVSSMNILFMWVLNFIIFQDSKQKKIPFTLYITTCGTSHKITKGHNIDIIIAV